MNRLENKVCLITGAAGSIGLATARLFLAEGAKVAMLDLAGDDLGRAAAGLALRRVFDFPADVPRGRGRRGGRRDVARWGEIDVLFSNAGNFGIVAPIAEYPTDVFEPSCGACPGAFLMAKHATPRMRDGGSVIITSSVAGVRGDPGVYGYIIAKHAQIGLMRCLAKELAPRRIRVNTIHPGPISNRISGRGRGGSSRQIHRDGAAFFNEMIPLGRHGSPEEIAQSSLYLACDESRFTTGSRLMATAE